MTNQYVLVIYKSEWFKNIELKQSGLQMGFD